MALRNTIRACKWLLLATAIMLASMTYILLTEGW
jgi:hypothetical protein